MTEEWADPTVYATLQEILLRSNRAAKQETAAARRDRLNALEPIFRARRRIDRTGKPVAILMDEWLGCSELYSQRKVQERARTARRFVPLPIPPLIDEALSDLQSPLSVLIGRAYFADSAKAQRRVVAKLRKLAQRGLNASRRKAAAVRREIPRTKRIWGGMDIVRKVLPYRAERRLLWLYITAELRQAGCGPEEPGDAAKARRREVIEEMLGSLPWLSSYYRLSVSRIESAVSEKNFANKETARQFGFKSANALQKFLSVHRPSR